MNTNRSTVDYAAPESGHSSDEAHAPSERRVQDEPSPSPAEMYEHYFVPGIFAHWTPVLLEYAAPQRGERVLDLACGTGIVARNVAPIVGAEGAVIGLDINSEMLAVARKLAPPDGASIEWRAGDAEALDLPDDAFDLVLCQQGLQFVPDRAAAVKEVHRVLASGGRVALSVWQGLERQPVYAALCEAEARHLDTSIDAVAGPAFSLGRADALRALLKEGGFDQIAVMPVSHTVRFPEPERFVMLTTLASAAVVPEFADMDEAARGALVEAVRREVDATLQTYVEDDAVVFPMHAHIAVAHA